VSSIVFWGGLFIHVLDKIVWGFKLVLENILMITADVIRVMRVFFLIVANVFKMNG
jgi:hypothetical protein